MKELSNNIKFPEDIYEKYERLIQWFIVKNEKTMIALSGGVDSALVAVMAKKALGKDKVLAVTANYKTLSNEELETAKKVALEIDIKHLITEYNELEDPNFVKNDKLRCYYCRNNLAEKLTEIAAKEKIRLIVDGSNIDDLKDYRPGMIALHKKGIKSPLIETGLNKKTIRYLAKEHRLSIYDKPSNSCLASRISAGREITSFNLSRIEVCEETIKQVFDVKHVRVRDHGDIARIETGRDEIINLFNREKLDTVVSTFKKNGFKYITIDIEGYKQSGFQFLS